MVGFDPKSDRKLTPFDHTVAGFVSGCGTRFLCQPLDVLKIRFQLQLERIHKTHTDRGKYTGMSQAARLIVREEGIRALWKGHVPAQCLSISYGVVKFQSFEFLTNKVWVYLPHKYTTDYFPVTHFICASFSACLATGASYPFDVVRTRLIGQGEPKVYKGVLKAASLMYKHEGALSFYKGFLPTIIQAAPYAGFAFAFYSSLTRIWRNYLSSSSKNKIDALQSFVCGGLSGFGAKVLTYPLDLCKKRLQVRGFEYARIPFGKVRRYVGLRHVLISVIKDEGFHGLFKGLWPSSLKAVFSTGLTFLFYEQTCNFLHLAHRKNE